MPTGTAFIVSVATALLVLAGFFVFVHFDSAPTETPTHVVATTTPSAKPSFGSGGSAVVRPQSTSSRPGSDEPLAANADLVAKAKKHLACSSKYDAAMAAKIPDFTAQIDASWSPLKSEHAAFYSESLGACAGIVMLLSESKGQTVTHLFNAEADAELDLASDQGGTVYQEFITHFVELQESGLR